MATILSDASQATTRSLRGLISIPNILSLDAPLVAIGWQWMMLFAFANPTLGNEPTQAAPMFTASTGVLFMTVWLIYTADRLLDCRRMDFDRKASRRHQFAKRWSPIMWPLWGVVLMLGGLLALTQLHRELLFAGSILLILVTLYVAAVHYFQHGLPKEFIVGSLFAIGVSLPLMTSRLTLSLVIAIGLLAALFVLNCLCVAKAQRASDRQQGIGSAILMFPHLSARLPWLAGMLAAASVVLGASGWTPMSIAATTSLSSILLIPIATSIDDQTGGLTASQWGELADYALLSPFLVMAIVT
ncbi:hypothetical protein [Novipirellula sp.]|uniref:hypothetical protein n=1 Tax=Novipirellula sp. TaxID=2795430 RepID=UPI0035679133